MRLDQTAQWQPTPAEFQAPGGPPQQPPPAPPKRAWYNPLRWGWRRIVLALIAFFMLIVAWLAITAPLSKSLQPIAAPSLTLVSVEGIPIARRGADIREPVKISALPKHVPNAFIAIEDRRFHSHLGISVRGIARAAWRNLGAGGVREGGSTITQQLAKISFLTADRTAARKAQEVLIAFWLEAWLSKEEILERYLSNVYLGDNTYGLRAASWHYFSVPPEKLSVPQAAMLAGMVKAPSRLAPTRNYKLARERGRVVIASMIEQGYVTPAQARRLKPAQLRVERQKQVPTGTYFADWVLPMARARGEVGYGDQEVQTTLESQMQKLALQTVRRAGLGRAQVALVAMRPDGRVVAMVGGKDYARSPFNRATQARRQPGSAFKLFVYLAALRAGMTPDTPVADTPLRVGKWQPKNYGDQYRGTLTLRDALALSSNVAAVRLSERVGRQNVIAAARDLGVRSPLTDNPSLALGTSGVTLLELTSAYAAVAAGAYPVRPKGLEDEVKPWWQRMWTRATGTSGDPAFDDLREMLGAVVSQGTGRGAALAVPAFGKTGTTQDSRDALFIGFAQDLVVGVWVGNDDNSPLAGQIAGGGLPARIWRDFMTQAVGTTPARKLAPPLQAPAPAPALNGSVTIPIEGTDGFEVGVQVDENGVSVTGDGVRLPIEDLAPSQGEREPNDAPPRDDAAPPPRDEPVPEDEQ
ncbi:MAG TPA: PBP1A family penicillin-binding protein [Allosphingosinicella sp.]|jgi:penicillin-binding protein 1A|nr:PBP1A family penicillin-binding protein [Allosphingosinicella sp.]